MISDDQELLDLDVTASENMVDNETSMAEEIVEAAQKAAVASEGGDDAKVLHWCRFDDSYSNPGFYIAFFVSGYAIPLLLIVLMYLFMLKRLWHPVGHQISQASFRHKAS